MKKKKTLVLVPSSSVVVGASAPSTATVVTATGKSRRAARKRAARRARARGETPAQNRKMASGRQMGPLTTAYIRSLNDPFNFAPPPLGVGTMIPLSRATAFGRLTFTPNTNNGYNLITVRPMMQGNVLTALQQAAGGSGWAANLTAANNNSTSLGTRFVTARCVSGGLRVSVLGASTLNPPFLMGGLIFDAQTAIGALTPFATAGEDQLRPLINVNNSAEVLWRPSDNTAYDLQIGSVTGWATSIVLPTMVVYISVPDGSAVNYNIVVDWILHFEGNSGVQVVGEDEDPNTLADEQPSTEGVLHLAARHVTIAARDLLVNTTNAFGRMAGAQGLMGGRAGRNAALLPLSGPTGPGEAEDAELIDVARGAGFPAAVTRGPVRLDESSSSGPFPLRDHRRG